MALADEVRDPLVYTMDNGGIFVYPTKHKYVAATPSSGGITGTATVAKPAGFRPRHVWLETYSGQKTERRKMTIDTAAHASLFPAGTTVTLSDGTVWTVAGYVGEKLRRSPGTIAGTT